MATGLDNLCGTNKPIKFVKFVSIKDEELVSFLVQIKKKSLEKNDEPDDTNKEGV